LQAGLHEPVKLIRAHGQTEATGLAMEAEDAIGSRVRGIVDMDGIIRDLK